MIGYKVMFGLNEGIQSTDLSDTAKTSVQWASDNYISTFDGIFLALAVFGLLAIAITAFYIDTHPVFFVVAILVFGLLSLVWAVFGNAYQEVAGSQDLAGIADQFTNMSFIMQYFPFYMLVVGFIVAIVLYSKIQSAGRGQ